MHLQSTPTVDTPSSAYLSLSQISSYMRRMKGGQDKGGGMSAANPNGKGEGK